MKKQIIAFVLTCLLLISVAPLASAVPYSEFYPTVNDNADMLSFETLGYIGNYNDDLYEYCDGVQVYVTTVPSLEGDSKENYSAAEPNGILLVISAAEREAWLDVGEELSEVFDGGDKATFLDLWFRDEFEKGNTDLAVQTLVSKLVFHVAEAYDADISLFWEAVEAEERRRANISLIAERAISYILLLAIIACFIYIIVVNFMKGYRTEASKSEIAASYKEMLRDSLLGIGKVSFKMFFSILFRGGFGGGSSGGARGGSGGGSGFGGGGGMGGGGGRR